MKMKMFLLVLAAFTVGPAIGRAQSYWLLTYSGTATHTNGLGKVVTEPMTDRTLVQRAADVGGVGTNGLGLVLHVNANVLGDALEVVNLGDPNLFRAEVFKL